MIRSTIALSATFKWPTKTPPRNHTSYENLSDRFISPLWRLACPWPHRSNAYLSGRTVEASERETRALGQTYDTITCTEQTIPSSANDGHSLFTTFSLQLASLPLCLPTSLTCDNQMGSFRVQQLTQTSIAPPPVPFHHILSCIF